MLTMCQVLHIYVICSAICLYSQSLVESHIRHCGCSSEQGRMTLYLNKLEILMI